MMNLRMLTLLTLLLTCCYATPPPGYVKPPEIDQNPPNYKYGYTIDDKKGSGQGKQESREGPFSLGRYYVQLGGASQNVEYFTDEWGYHPLVEYSSVNDHSQTSASFALGEKAVEALKNNRQNPSKQEIKISSPKPEIKTPEPTAATTLPQQTKGDDAVNQIPQDNDGKFNEIQPQQILLTPQTEQNAGQYILQNQVQSTIQPQYIYHNLPQPQMILSQDVPPLPQPAMLIQTQDMQQPHYLIPIYQDNLGINVDQNNFVQLQYIQTDQQQPTGNVFVVQNQQNEQKVNNKEQNVQTTKLIPQNVQQGQYLIETSPRPLSYQEGENNVYNNQNYKTVTTHNNQINVQVQNLENQALFSEIDTPVKYSSKDKNQIQNDEKFEKINEADLSVETQGDYGAKITTKFNNVVNDARATPTQAPIAVSTVQVNLGINKQKNKKTQKFEDNSQLIDRTKSLVSGVDVLNINEAASNTISNGEYTEYNNGGQFNYEINQSTASPNSGQTATSYTSQNSVHVKDNNPARTKLISILNSEKVKTYQEQKINFNENPIVVPDFDYQDNAIQSTTEVNVNENFYSTTRNTIETEINGHNSGVTESSILITPKPIIGSAFLSPITAAVALQNSAESQNVIHQQEPVKSNTIVEVQKSIPYYIGKVELYDNAEISQGQFVSIHKEPEKILTYLQKENANYVSSTPQPNEVPKSEALIQQQFVDNVKVDQQALEEQELSIHLPLNGRTRLNRIKDDKSVTVLQPYPEEKTKIIEKPVEVVKIVEKQVPVEVQVPVHIPYEVQVPVERQVPVTVEKIVEKPVEITKIVEKQVPIHIPQPYAVEVEKIVEKEVQVPFEVTKYVDKPYPVHIPVPHPVAVPVEVERIVEKIVKQPYRVEVPIRVEVPVKVPVPHPVPVTKFIEKPYPVEKIIEKPVKVEKIVEKPVTKYINRPYPVHIRVPVPTPVAVPVEVKVPYPYPFEVPKYLNHIPQDKPYGVQALTYRYPFQKQLSAQSINVPVSVAPTKLHQISFDINKYKPQHLEPISSYLPISQHNNLQKIVPNPYQYAPKYQPHWKNINCDFHVAGSSPIRTSKSVDFVGLVPPLPPHNVFYRHVDARNYKRRPRQSFGENLRVEYGFKPPLIPSVETDEHGTPIEKDDD